MEITEVSQSPILAQKQIAETISRLNKWVKLPTHISFKENIFLLQQLVAEELKGLGFNIEYFESDGLNVLVASTPLALIQPGITLVGHVDTALVGGGAIEINQEWATAVGVGDNKGGVMVGLRALEKLGKEKIQSLPLRFVISPNEESGSNGFHELFKDLSQKTDWVLGLEPALASGDLIHSRCGNRWYHIKAKGIGAHAGRFNEPHANPVHAIAQLISKLIPYNDDSKKRRVNATDIKVSPGIVNAIPDQAELKIDARFSTQDDLALINSMIENELRHGSITCPVTNKKISYETVILDDCPALEKRGPNWFYELALESIQKQEDKKYACLATGGASDANHFHHAKKGVLDGLGPIARGMHTMDESILISSLETRSNALCDFISALGERNA